MSYAAAIDRLYALAQELHTPPGQPRRKFELDHMRVLMAALGDPQRDFPAILVAGTNGKGSTSATLAGILASAGYRTGLYTSPHLSRVNERIRIDGIAIGDSEFAALFFQVEEAARSLVRQDRLPGMPSFFETVTAIGFLHFAARKVDTAVLEVGMGGRLDATNIVEPQISVITDISLDHTEWLGSTVREIALEKAGILRRGGVMVTLPQHPEANQALGEAAVSLGVRGVNAAEYLPAGNIAPEGIGNRYSLTVLGEPIEIDAKLDGEHQRRNLALAVASAVEIRHNHSYNIRPAEIARGIRDTLWPGRLETIAGSGGRADVLLDVAHNPAGAWALRAALSRLGSSRRFTLIFSCLRDKPAVEMAQILFPLFDRVILTQVDSPRAASMEDLLAAARLTGSEAEAAESPLAALARAFSLTPPGGMIVVTGSFYLVGAAREHLVPDRETVSR